MGLVTTAVGVTSVLVLIALAMPWMFVFVEAYERYAEWVWRVLGIGPYE